MTRQHLTPGKDPVPIVQEDVWASGPVWTGAENFASPGFYPRTVQPVGSRYTDYATPHTPRILYCIKFLHCYMIFTCEQAKRHKVDTCDSHFLLENYV